MGIKIDAAACNVIGGRKNNEDNFYLNGIMLAREQMDKGGRISMKNTQPLQVYAVFDGMGGGEYGEFASCYAAAELKKYQESSEHMDHADNLRNFLTETSKKIDHFSEEKGLRSGACGSTAAILILEDWWYRTAHVGDSRIYLLREGRLSRITKDQSEVQRLVDAQKITLEEAWSHPRKNVITHHLGMPLRTDQLQSIISERSVLCAGDCFLICSDGVNDSLRDEEIKSCLNLRHSAEEIAKDLVRQAKRRADERHVNSDNVTAVVLKVLQVADVGADARRVRKLRFVQKLSAALAALFAMGAVASFVFMLQAML